MKWRPTKVEKQIKWIKDVYTPRTQAISPSTILSIIEPFGGKPHPRFRQFWYFDTMELRVFWKEYLEEEFEILIQQDATGMMRIVEGMVLIGHLVRNPGKNNTLTARLNALIKKEKKKGRRR